MKNGELIFVKSMFDKIAAKYDFLNRLLSLGQDKYWRRSLVKAINISENGKVLDVACGTGDVMLEIAQREKNRICICGVDFSSNMLAFAKEKSKVKGYSNLYFVAGDALSLPFAKHSFDIITIAFGIRNITNKLFAIKSFKNRLKKNGMLLVLELSTPEKGLFLALFLLYFKKILPLIGGLFSKNFHAYTYLPDSVINFPKPNKFAELMEDAGFINIKWKRLTLGVATLFVGQKG